MADLRKQRFDTAMIPHDALQQDPSQVFVAVKAMTEARGQIGDVIIVMVPPGSGPESARFLQRQLGDRGDNPMHGLPGGPAL